MRGIVDPNGEQFGYVRGDLLYTLDDEVSGRIKGQYVEDLAGNKVWRIIGDGVYNVDTLEPVGYLTEPSPNFD
jgi:hypothetical protein